MEYNQTDYQHIQAQCQARLAEIYPAGIPEAASARLDAELEALRNSTALDDFKLFAELSAAARQGGYLIRTRGTVLGSILVYLLGYGQMNPLPAHTYCPQCGDYQQSEQARCGMDLPEQVCPHCGAPLRRDGFHLPLESVWGNGAKVPSFQYHVPTEFEPFAHHVFRTHFREERIMNFGSYGPDETTGAAYPLGICVLPPNLNLDDCADLMGVQADGTDCLLSDQDSLTALGIRCIWCVRYDFLDRMLAAQRQAGIFSAELTPNLLADLTWRDVVNTGAMVLAERRMFEQKKPYHKEEMLNLLSAGHCAYADADTDDEECHKPYIFALSETPAFQKYPCYSREDFFEHLIACGFNRARAFEISEFIRKGFAANGMPKYQEKLQAYQLPPELEMLAKKYAYLSPRADSAWFMLQYLRLAKYLKTDPQAYSRAIFSGDYPN